MNFSIKTKLIAVNMIILIIAELSLIALVYYNFNKYAISENIDKARKAAKQLIAMRSFMATIAPYTKFTDEKINRWAATPAYSGGMVSRKFGKEAGFYIKQTSLKYRNPLNKPNQNEVKMLQLLEKNKAIEYWTIGEPRGIRIYYLWQNA